MALRDLLVPWDRQPATPQWSPLALRAAALVHTGSGVVRGKNGAAIALVGSAAATKPDRDGAYLIGRSEEGQTRLGRWNLLTQPASITAYTLVFRLRRSTQSLDGQVVAWGESAVAVRNRVLATTTGLRVDARQNQFDTPRSETYALSAGVTHTWGVRVVAGVGIEVYRDGILQTPTASSGTMPASSLFAVSTQPVWLGAEGDFSALGGLYGYGLWFEDLGADTVRALSADIHNGLHEPLRIWVPVSAGGGGATDLTVSEASHGHSADSLTLSTGVSLAINDATHWHAAEALTLTTASTLAVADATHAHAADQVTLTLAGSESLTIADSTHAHIADAPVLSVDSLLAVDDALHAHSADNVVLGVTGVADLIIADATHAHSVDGLVLTAQSLLAIQDALHAHAADELTLNSAPTLLIAEALHAHTSDGLLLTVDAWLVIADALHGHTADSITLGDSGAVVLVVADAVHAHAADTLRLFYEVWAATKAPIGARHASGARAARLSTTARPPRLSTRTR